MRRLDVEVAALYVKGMKTIRLILSSAGLGSEADEKFFDAWASYVAEHADAIAGEPVEVEQARFGEAGEDVIEGADEEVRDRLRSWLAVDGWDAFCSMVSA